MFGMVTAIIVEADETFDPTINPINPSNWRNTAGPPLDMDMDMEDSGV